MRPTMQGNRRIAMVDTDTGAFMAALGAFLVNPGSFGFLRFRIPVRTYLDVSERVARVVE
jgi:hypothetical protein